MLVVIKHNRLYEYPGAITFKRVFNNPLSTTMHQASVKNYQNLLEVMAITPAKLLVIFPTNLVHFATIIGY